MVGGATPRTFTYALEHEYFSAYVRADEAYPCSGRSHYSDRKKPLIVAKNMPGCSRLERCPAFGMTANCAPGMRSAYAWDSEGGIIASCWPVITNVGKEMLASKSLESARRAMPRDAAAMPDGVAAFII